MEGDEVDDEDVASPGRDHVEVGHGSPRPKVHAPCLDSFDPQVVGEHEGKYGDSLIVIAACHAPVEILNCKEQ